MRRASSSKTSMNSLPMILRFFSGSLTPASFFRKRSVASTATRCSPSLSRRFCCTFSNSFLRSTPLLTKTQVSRDLPVASRMARSTSTAATDESTPPESAQMARPLPTCCFTCCDGRIDEVLRRPGRLRAADVEDEVAQDLRAERRVVDFGMKLHRPHFLRRDFQCRPPRWESSPSVETRRQFVRLVAVRHPDRQILASP